MEYPVLLGIAQPELLLEQRVALFRTLLLLAPFKVSLAL